MGKPNPAWPIYAAVIVADLYISFHCNICTYNFVTVIVYDAFCIGIGSKDDALGYY